LSRLPKKSVPSLAHCHPWVGVPNGNDVIHGSPDRTTSHAIYETKRAARS
jgi:hypothetical protein